MNRKFNDYERRTTLTSCLTTLQRSKTVLQNHLHKHPHHFTDDEMQNISRLTLELRRVIKTIDPDSTHPDPKSKNEVLLSMPDLNSVELDTPKIIPAKPAFDPRKSPVYHVFELLQIGQVHRIAGIKWGTLYAALHRRSRTNGQKYKIITINDDEHIYDVERVQ